MDLLKLKTVQWLSIVGAVAGILGLLAPWESRFRPALMIAVLGLTTVFLLLELEQGRMSLLFTGLSRYYPSFVQSQNDTVLAQTEQEYCYFGVSFSTVLNAFRQWYDVERLGNASIRLLLLDPEATDILEYQARCEHGILDPVSSTAEREVIDGTVRRSRAAITHALSTLATLKDGPSKIEVRFHREKVNHWMHLIDDTHLYVGILRNGQSGLSAPVLLLRPRLRKWTLFNWYQEEWNNIWVQAKSVNLGSFAKPVVDPTGRRH